MAAAGNILSQNVRMHPWFQTVTDLAAQADILRMRRYGVIDVTDERFRSVRLRPFPKLVSLADCILWGERYHRCRPGNRCLVYYNQPRGFGNFLALVYGLSARHTTLATFRRALGVLDQIAQLKGTDALLCDAANTRISDRLLARCGWEPHKPERWHRHFIKRFYGRYPPPQVDGHPLTSPLPLAKAALEAWPKEAFSTWGAR